MRFALYLLEVEMPFQPTHRVASTSLNLRSEPEVRPSNRIAVLPAGQPVEKLAEHDANWWQVAIALHDAAANGFVAARFLEPITAAPDPLPSLPVGSIPPAHLRENRAEITRQNDRGRAFPLGEPGRPARTSADPVTRAAELSAIFDWLDVEHSHRYAPTTSSTYCNIYAHDVAYLAGVYLPRVWWTGGALLRLCGGEAVPVLYDQTVVELNANSLLVWFADFGAVFGWRRTLDLEELQQAANQGGVGIIVARHQDANRSGHIATIEREGAGLQAARVNGKVTRPITSQAGRENHRRQVPSRPWWAMSPHSSWAAWWHD